MDTDCVSLLVMNWSGNAVNFNRKWRMIVSCQTRSKERELATLTIDHASFPGQASSFVIPCLIECGLFKLAKSTLITIQRVLGNKAISCMSILLCGEPSDLSQAV